MYWFLFVWLMALQRGGGEVHVHFTRLTLPYSYSPFCLIRVGLGWDAHTYISGRVGWLVLGGITVRS